MVRSTPPTNFAAIDEITLKWMLWQSNEVAIRDLSDIFGATGSGIQERATDIEFHFRRLKALWTGETADSYSAAIDSLNLATKRVADSCLVIRDILADVSDALEQAKAQFPPPEGFNPDLHAAPRPDEVVDAEIVDGQSDPILGPLSGHATVDATMTDHTTLVGGGSTAATDLELAPVSNSDDVALAYPDSQATADGVEVVEPVTGDWPPAGNDGILTTEPGTTTARRFP